MAIKFTFKFLKIGFTLKLVPLFLIPIPFILFPLVFLTGSSTLAHDIPNSVQLGLIGQLNNDYGEFCRVKLFEYEESDFGGNIIVNYAYCITSKGLVILNIDKGTTASFIPLGNCKDIEIEKTDKENGHYVYVTEDEAGLYIMKVDNPKEISYVAKCDTSGESLDVTIDKEGWYAYVADGLSGLQVIDIRDKSRPKIVGNFSRYYSYAISVVLGKDAEYVYVVDRNSGLLVIDIRDKSNPNLVGSTMDGYFGFSDGTGYQDAAIDTGNEYIYIIHSYGSYYSKSYKSCSRLQVIDIRDKSNPYFVSTCEVPGQAKSVAIDQIGEYAYVVDWEIGLQIIDITDRAGPNIVSTCDTPGSALDVIIDKESEHAYVADGYIGGLQIIDIRDKTDPNIVEAWDTSSYWESKAMAIKGDYVYIANGNNWLEAIDISDKNEMNIIGTCDITDHAMDMAIDEEGEYAYVATIYNGLEVIDISDKNRMNIIDIWDTPDWACRVILDKEGEYAYVADVYSGLKIIDISNPDDPNSVPSIIGTCDILGQAGSLVIDKKGEYAYVFYLYWVDGGSGSMSGFQIIDIGDKNNPKKVGLPYEIPYGTSAYMTGLVLCGAIDEEGEYAYVVVDPNEIGGDTVLQVIDIKNKSTLELIGELDVPGGIIPGGATSLTIKGEYAYFVGYSSLQIIDISNRSNPEIVGTYETSDSKYPWHVAIDNENEYVYIKDDGGLLKLKIDIGLSSKGNLILVAGGAAGAENNLWPATQAQANYVFTTFINGGYEVYDILYQNPIFLQDIENVQNELIVDEATPTKVKLKTAITNWAIESPNTGPLYIYLIGHGAEDRFQIMPNEVITAVELKNWISEFQYGYTDDDGTYHPGTDRQAVIIIETAASGSFIDDLAGENITIITSTNDGASYIKPFFDPNELSASHPGNNISSYKSFTTAFIDAFSLHPHASTNDPLEISSFLMDSFCTARTRLEQWGIEGPPFDNQAPQMATADSEFISLSFSKDGKTPIKEGYLLIDQPIPNYLTIIGEDTNGQILPYMNDDLILSLSAPDILDANRIEIDFNEGPIYRIVPNTEKAIDPNGILWYAITPEKNGTVTLTAFAEQDPNLLISAKLTIEVSVSIDDYPSYAADIDKMAIIITGYEGTGDYLWESTNEIGNHVYQTLRAMDYEKEEIFYYNPYLIQDLDGKPGYDISGYPYLSVLNPERIIPNPPLKELLIFFVDHGLQNEFCLNPRENLKIDRRETPEVDSLVEIIEENAGKVDEKIILIFDACYSGSFLDTIEEADLSEDITKKLIIITSTGADQTAYFLNRGMVSFSRAFFDEWFLTRNILDAFEYSRQSLPLIGQDPKISDPNIIELWDRQKTYYIDDSRPVIDEVEAYRSQGRLHIEARIYSLVGINEVLAVIEDPQSAILNSYGDTITSALEFHLTPSDPNNPYGGEYTLTVPDPSPNETNYIINIYSQDKGKIPKTSSYKTALGNEIESKTRAVIMASENMDSWQEQEKVKKQIIRAKRILECKGLSGKIHQIAQLEDFSNIILESDQTLFIYLIGKVAIESEGKPYFYPDPNQKFSAVEFYDTLYKKFPDPNTRILILIDTPYAERFLSAGLDPNNGFTQWNPNSWPESWAGMAGTEGEHLFFPIKDYKNTVKLYPCFSDFFFSFIRAGGTVARAYMLAKNSVSFVRQTPALFLPEKAESYYMLNRHLGYYLGEAAITGEDYSLFIDCNAQFEDPNLYTISLTSHPDAEITNAWVVLTYSTYFYEESMIVDFDPNKAIGRNLKTIFLEELTSGEKYYKAIFMVNGYRRDDPNTILTQWEETPVVNFKTDIGPDIYESDDDPHQILFDTNHIILVNAPPRRHTFYYESSQVCDDRDWVFFYGFKDSIYEIYAQDLSEYGYFVQLSLYDLSLNSDTNNEFYLSGYNNLSFLCPKDGYYLLDAALASSYPSGGVEYILSVCDPKAGNFVDILVQIVDPNDNGIEGLVIKRTNPLRTSINLGNGEYLISLGGMTTDTNISLDVYLGGKYIKSLIIDNHTTSNNDNSFSFIGSKFTLDLSILYNYQTVPLHLKKGINLYYFPNCLFSYDESFFGIISTSQITPQIYNYNPDSKIWNEASSLMANSFNAIYITEEATLYLDIDEPDQPVLHLKRFLDPDYFQNKSNFSIEYLDKDLFDPAYFCSNGSTMEILSKQSLETIEMICGQNLEKGSWEAGYRFFGKFAGRDIYLRPLNIYIVTRKK